MKGCKKYWGYNFTDKFILVLMNVFRKVIP